MTGKALEIYDILRGIGLEEEKARKFVDYVEETGQTRIEKEIKNLATKEDLVREIATTKVDIIKWMFIFWVGQVAVISGIIFAMLTLFFK